MSGVLVAGIGNIFHGDDGFGVAVAQQLAGRGLPPGVRVVDFGIRGLDLVYALLDGYSAAILIDAVERGDPPGTLSVIEPERPRPAISKAGRACFLAARDGPGEGAAARGIARRRLPAGPADRLRAREPGRRRIRGRGAERARSPRR